MVNRAIFSALIIATGLAFAGCAGGGGSVSESRPVSEIAAEAKNMAVAELQNIVAKYKQVIAVKQVDIQALQAKIKEIPLTQLLGEEAKKLKTDISTIAASVSALTERMNVYIQELKAKGGTI
jgi:hypothetical protein